MFTTNIYIYMYKLFLLLAEHIFPGRIQSFNLSTLYYWFIHQEINWPPWTDDVVLTDGIVNLCCCCCWWYMRSGNDKSTLKEKRIHRKLPLIKWVICRLHLSGLASVGFGSLPWLSPICLVVWSGPTTSAGRFNKHWNVCTHTHTHTHTHISCKAHTSTARSLAISLLSRTTSPL